MREFSDERLRAVIADSPILLQMTGAGIKGKHEVQNVLTKRWLNQSKILLRSVYKNADRVRGIPADVLGVDELQDVLTDNLPVIEETLFASSLDGGPVSVYAGTPKSYENAIEFYWSRYSTQNEWMVRCDGCTYWNCIEVRNIGPTGLVCTKCGREVNPVDGKAQWVRFGGTDREWEGFHLSQPIAIYSSRHQPDVFQRKWAGLLEKKKRYTPARLQNEVMGRSHDAGTKPVTLEEVRRCALSEYHIMREPSRAIQSGHSWAGVDWGCHDEQTEVLTESGWKLFQEVLPGEKVAQFNQDTRALSFTVPTAFTAKDYEGELLHFEGRGIDMALTPDHRMFVRGHQGSWHVEPAYEVSCRAGSVHLVGKVEWSGNDVESFTLPSQPVSPGYRGCAERTFHMDDWLELLGYWLSEGGLCMRKGQPYCIKMSQGESVSPIKADFTRLAMDRLGISYQEYPNPQTGDVNWTIREKQYWDWWAKNIGLTGDTKRIPRWAFNLSKRQLHILFEAMVLSGGSMDHRPGNWNGCYTSTSEGLIRDFQELCVYLGLKSTVRMSSPAHGSRKARYVCSFSRGRDLCFNLPRERVRRVPYKGKVYCCTVPDGFIVTRRNGCVAYQGNSGEQSYTVLSIWNYDSRGRFRCIFAKKYEGLEADSDHAIADIIRWCRKFNVNRIGVDWGFGFHANPHLRKVFGPAKVLYYFHAGSQKEKVKWDKAGAKFTTHRTRVLQDVFTLIKRGPTGGGIAFPCWEEFEPFANDILSVYTEMNRMNEMVFDHPKTVPDDFLHTVVYALLASQFDHPRPDLHAPAPGVKGN
jgi:hypothetical protein